MSQPRHPSGRFLIELVQNKISLKSGGTMKPLLLTMALFFSSHALFAQEAILSKPKACLAVDENAGTPSGCKTKFRAADKIHVFSNIETPGVYKLNAVFELQDDTRKNKPINIDIDTQADWNYVYFWMTPNTHDDKYLGTWKITIYVHTESGDTSEYSTTFQVVK
jgi:hypothetical protein